MISDFMVDNWNIIEFGDPSLTMISSSGLRSFIADQLLLKDKSKFILLSGHDTTIALLLASLDLKQDYTVPFAATMIFELWNLDGDRQVKLLYNDVELDLFTYCHGESSPSDQKSCSLDAFT